MKIAVIGSGISGLTAAHLLQRDHEVHLYEAASRLGGHTNTIDVTVDGATFPIDTGFLVYAPSTYPNFIRLLDELGVATTTSDMSFSVRDDARSLEWKGATLRGVFAQPRNLLRPRFLRMLVEIVQLNRSLNALVRDPLAPAESLGAFVERKGFSRELLEWYLVPLGASIWSSTPESFLEMPVTMLARFLERHGLLQVADHPEWRTIVGGARTYVEAITAPLAAAERIHLNSPVSGISRGPDGVTFSVAGNPIPHHADHVIVATHADQALATLAAPTAAEREVLGAIHSSRNVITVHGDASVMPRARHAWASWNYHHGVGAAGGVTMTYYLNTLQPLPTNAPVFESLNRSGAIDPALVLSEFVFHHPILDGPAVAAQQRHGEISGVDGISFCGAYWTHGFHEDGATSGVRVARALGATW